ncbi:GIP [Symbiodinium sp. KB8]|nr:GIP [Symbiodinium sp. KB8]
MGSNQLSVDSVKDSTINEAVLFLMKETEGERRQRTQQISEELQQLQEDVLGRLKERREWLQEFLAEEEILAEEMGVVGEAINEEIMGINGVVRDLIQDVETQVKEVEKKCEDLYLRVANVDDDKEIGDIEDYLGNLKKDLEVTLDVPLDQVKSNLDLWVEPMAKELANLEEKTGAIERWSIAEARKLEREGRLILIPGKVVCTVKPPAPLGPGSPPSTVPRWKRKARVVICGNMAGQTHDPNDLFAAGASVEGLRLALAIAVSMGWCVASTDVSAAFLQALWPRDRPTYGVLPPKVLQQAGLVEQDVVFVVRRALYGLRESPALWAAHRTEVLGRLSVNTKEGRVFLKQMTTDSELWMILLEPTKGAKPILRGILVTYVDDLLYLAARDLILNLHEEIASIWPCSDLEFATEGLRYLGMELVQEESTVTLSQEAYVDNLVRLHGLDPQSKAGLPCPKEWLQDEDFNDVAENFNEEELKRAQKVTGECLWLAYRTRPDILFVTNYMAAMTSRKPVKVYNVGLKVISYLNATAGLKLKVAATAEQTQSTAEQTQSTAEQPMGSQVKGHLAGFRVPLAGCCDASFAPYGGKSYGCSMTMLDRTPVWWKAGKQQLVAMSVCEAELLEGSNCALLLESTMSMVRELLPDSVPPRMYIDNQAAGNLLNGSTGSWRTRHLRIRHSYVLDRVKSGHVVVEHIAGEDQPADLPTKMHSRARLIHLLEAWGMVGIPELDARTTLKGLKLGCVFLLLLAIQSLAVEAAKDPLPATGTMELFLMLMLTCVSAVALWELGKAIGNFLDRAISEEENGYEHGRDAAGFLIHEGKAYNIHKGEAYNTYKGEAYNAYESEAYNTYESEIYHAHNEFATINPHWAGDTCPQYAGGQFERDRVVKDTLGLMTVQHLKEGWARGLGMNHLQDPADVDPSSYSRSYFIVAGKMESLLTDSTSGL